MEGEREISPLGPVGDSGNWELKLPIKAMKHLDLYKMKVYWNGGCGERIPAWCQRVVQDESTKIFSAQVWDPEKPLCVPPSVRSVRIAIRF